MKINISKTDKLQGEISKVEKGARARLLSIRDLGSEIETIEDKLVFLLPKKEWRGLKFEIDVNASHFPASYQGIPMSTQVVIERGAAAWFVTGVTRNRVKAPSNEIVPVNLEDKAEALVSYVCSNGWG